MKKTIILIIIIILSQLLNAQNYKLEKAINKTIKNGKTNGIYIVTLDEKKGIELQDLINYCSSKNYTIINKTTKQTYYYGSIVEVVNYFSFLPGEEYEAKIKMEYEVAKKNREELAEKKRIQDSLNLQAEIEKKAKIKTEIENGTYTGIATYYYSTNEYYEGNFVNSLINGYGTYHYSNGERYSGNWLNGIRSGTGSYYYSDESYYSGEWVNDKKQGEGKLYKNFKLYFDGNWYDDKMNGQGVYYKGWDYWTGKWVNGQKNGNFTYYSTNILGTIDYEAIITYSYDVEISRTVYIGGNSTSENSNLYEIVSFENSEINISKSNEYSKFVLNIELNCACTDYTPTIILTTKSGVKKYISCYISFSDYLSDKIELNSSDLPIILSFSYKSPCCLTDAGVDKEYSIGTIKFSESGYWDLEISHK